MLAAIIKIWYYLLYESLNIQMSSNPEYVTLSLIVLMIVVICAFFIKKETINKELKKLRNKYINDKKIQNISNTNVVVYDWNYKEHHNRRGAL
jgi:hypothetical protein